MCVCPEESLSLDTGANHQTGVKEDELVAATGNFFFFFYILTTSCSSEGEPSGKIPTFVLLLQASFPFPAAVSGNNCRAAGDVHERTNTSVRNQCL